MNEISPFYEDFFFVFFLMFPIKCQRPEHKITLACDLTTEKEQIKKGTCAEIMKEIETKKAEFMLIIH